MKIDKLAEELAEEYGTTPLKILMEFATRDEDPKVRLEAATAAAPYMHAKLKQVEVTDATPRRSAAEVEGDIARFLAELAGGSGTANAAPEPRAARDLIGADPRAGGTAPNKLH